MSDETTTEMLAKIEGQAEYTPPDGWRVLQPGEVLEGEDWLIDPRNGKRRPTLRLGHKVEHQIYIRRIESEPQPFITPDDVAAEALAGAWDKTQAEQQIAELQAQVAYLKTRELTLGTRLEQEKAVTTKRLQQIDELRSEVSHVQRLWGESRRRVEELETLVADLRAVNAATEKAVNSAARDKADLESRLRAVAAEFGVQLETNHGLQTQLEAVKAELVQVSKDRQALQIELDAREQVPQAVSDRFEEGWDKGTAQAVETIAEWTEPFRTCGSQGLAWAIMQNLPHIMRTLTGLAEED